MKTAAALCLLAIGALAPASHVLAGPTVLYNTNFESFSPDQYWTNAHMEINAWDAFTDFNGRFSNSYTQFQHAQPSILPGVGGIGSGTQSVQYYLTFDFYAFDAWTNQQFNVTANGTTIFSALFSNTTTSSAQTLTPNAGPSPMGFNSSYNDSIYRNIEVPFTVPSGQDITLRFADGGDLAGINFESWGIDNVSVSYEAVPAPSGLAALGAGSLFVGRRRRR
jgi:hypothetical protein